MCSICIDCYTNVTGSLSASLVVVIYVHIHVHVYGILYTCMFSCARINDDDYELTKAKHGMAFFQSVNSYM